MNKIIKGKIVQLKNQHLKLKKKKSVSMLRIRIKKKNLRNLKRYQKKSPYVKERK